VLKAQTGGGARGRPEKNVCKGSTTKTTSGGFLWARRVRENERSGHRTERTLNFYHNLGRGEEGFGKKKPEGKNEGCSRKEAKRKTSRDYKTGKIS